ncbi:hypothetical protein J53TS2_14700 [Paenibacillus sp. J53TS2]|nr:hypothetical protein J53TS2_14700 [Paenibacillus sp. J53TS2]
MIAREGLKKPLGIVISFDRERSHSQPGSPSLGARLQFGDMVRSKLQIHELVKEGFSFGKRKLHIGSAELR